jgi:hypothetical protein
MVDYFTALSIVNKSLADLGNNINQLSVAEDVKINNDVVRLGEDETYITEKGDKLNQGVAIAYTLAAYRKNFYLMDMDVESGGVNLYALPIDSIVDCDMTEFNLEEDTSGFKRNNF